MHTKTLVVSAIMMGPLTCLGDHVAVQFDGGPGSAITTMGAETLGRGQQVVGLQYQFLDLKELSNEQLLDSEEALHSVKSFSQATIGYSLGITDQFTLSAVLPYVSRDGFRGAAHDHHEATTEVEHHDTHSEDGDHQEQSESAGELFTHDLSGWGDLSMLGRFALTRDDATNQYFVLLAVIKLPTGSINERLGNGEKAEVEHQPGSGSWDPLLGVAYSNRLTTQWSISSNLLYRLTTEGARETEIGDSLMYNVAILWAPPSHSHQGEASHIDYDWQYVLELNGEWHAKTRTGGSKDNNTGGDVIFATAGLRWSYEDWGTHISLATPLYKNFNGVQSEPDWRLSTGVSFSF